MTSATNIVIDREVLAEMKPLLERDGMTFSGFVRKAMLDYLEAHKSKDIVVNIGDLK